MPLVDCTYIFALDLPIPNIMEPAPPPDLSIRLFCIRLPSHMKSKIGKIHVNRKLASGDMVSLISPENLAPDSDSRSISSGSFIFAVS